MGFTALAAAFIAARQTSPAAWIQTWLVEAVLAVAIAAAALQAKARRAGLPMTSGPGRKFAFSFVPPIAAGAVLTPILYQAGLTRLLPGAWLLLYGVGVVTGGAFSVSSVPVMGAAFMALGSMVLLLPAAWPGLASPNLAMAAGFGVLHIVFGILIARKHGG